MNFSVSSVNNTRNSSDELSTTTKCVSLILYYYMIKVSNNLFSFNLTCVLAISFPNVTNCDHYKTYDYFVL